MLHVGMMTISQGANTISAIVVSKPMEAKL